MTNETKKLIGNILTMNSEIDELTGLCNHTVKHVKVISEKSKHSEDPEFEQEVTKFEKFVKEISSGNSSSSQSSSTGTSSE